MDGSARPREGDRGVAGLEQGAAVAGEPHGGHGALAPLPASPRRGPAIGTTKPQCSLHMTCTPLASMVHNAHHLSVTKWKNNDQYFII